MRSNVGVLDVHEARARWLGHQVHADLHITVDANLTVTESHAIVDRVKAMLPSTSQASAVRWSTSALGPSPWPCRRKRRPSPS